MTRARVIQLKLGRRRSNGHRMSFNIQPAQLILLSFFLIILLGAFLLMLPQASVRQPLSFIDALFTSTSATCVTGLVVRDTGADFTRFGQWVILCLIQLGGLGIMTLSTFFVYLVAGRLSYTGREIVQDTFSQHPMAELGRLLRLVFLTTLSIEGAGAVLLGLKFSMTHGWSEAFYMGVFHSVSAFCNAGFALFPDSFVAFRDDAFVNAVLSILIILGGLGFIVIFDLFRNRGSLRDCFWRKLQFHTRIVLFATACLLVGGFFLIFLLETRHSVSGLPLGERLLAAWFQSVTTRTAGFNTLDIGDLSNATLFVMTILMFVGASPGSCGGGIKSTTFVVILASVRARFRMQEDVNLFHRRLSESVVSRAISVMFLSGIIVTLFTMLILVTESVGGQAPGRGDSFISYFFEVVSAFGTVGLSTGVTPQLSESGKCLITALMFIGRLGPLTISLAVQGRTNTVKFRYAKENVLVG